MKIGIQILAYNCADTFEKLIKPWVKLKSKYDIKIWVGSGQFKLYNEMGCENLNGFGNGKIERKWTYNTFIR